MEMLENLLASAEKHWNSMFMIFGAAILIASLGVDRSGFGAFGIGLLFVGWGDRINRPFVTIPTHWDGFGRILQAFQGRPYRPHLAGLVLVVFGCVLLFIGTLKIVFL